jgi:hypothetical protein
MGRFMRAYGPIQRWVEGNKACITTDVEKDLV